MSQPQEQIKTRGVRQVLTTVAEVRAAVIQVTAVAKRTLSIMTHDLEPDVYDHDDYLETLKKFHPRTHLCARPRADPPAGARLLSASRFVAMGRRLNSYIEFRRITPDLANHPEAFFIADEHALVYRARAESWDGMSDTYEPAVARREPAGNRGAGHQPCYHGGLAPHPGWQHGLEREPERSAVVAGVPVRRLEQSGRIRGLVVRRGQHVARRGLGRSAVGLDHDADQLAPPHRHDDPGAGDDPVAQRLGMR